jgi:hypothetical protein
MPGSPVFHGQPTSTTAQGVGGANRVQSSVSTAGFSDMNFFVWLAIIGIAVPLLLIGGLRIGGFQFVFRR